MIKATSAGKLVGRVLKDVGLVTVGGFVGAYLEYQAILKKIRGMTFDPKKPDYNHRYEYQDWKREHS